MTTGPDGLDRPPLHDGARPAPSAPSHDPDRSALVLGAGMVGTCTAWHLARRGWSVVLVDRRAPGEETSFGNAGLIQREAVSPYPFPQDLGAIAAAALRRGAAVSYHLAALPRLVGPLWGYFRHSGARRYPAAVSAYARLIAHATSEHAPMVEATGAEDLIARTGYWQAFRSDATRDAAFATAERLRAEHGVAFEAVDGAALAQREPGLRQRLAGALHFPQPWAVRDPGALVQRYAAGAQRLGVRLLTGDAASLQGRPGGGWRVQTAEGPVDAAHAVIALGPWADTLLERLGYRWPLFVKRGYHRHYRGTPGTGPVLPLLDADRGYVLAPMARGTRLTTGAEFAHRDAPASPRQLGLAEAAARELFDLPEPVEAEPWLGARPCTPDLVPMIGAAPRHAGLWINAGHSHQGFTLGPVSGRLLAERMGGEPTLVDLSAYAPGRFEA